ncbi:uncharacterized protein LOC135205714 isoform X3 [Macrobrachium nipponense]|uniref:uncharacterized protein LOC135205714 isoform X3 n=1 Tax=Macrobrachium nipponense TaxID=159736 RepID=UPI0030C7D092
MSVTEDVTNNKGERTERVAMAKELENAIKEGVVEEVREANGTSYNCTVCPKQLKTKDTIKHHLKSNKHVKKLQEKKQKDGTETTDTNQDSPRGEKMPNRRTNANQRKGGKIEPKRNEVKEHEEVVPAIHEPNEEKEDNTDLVSNGLEENQVGLNKMEKDGISIENDPTPEGENLVEEAFQHNILFANDVCSDASPYWCTLCLKPLKVYGKLASHLSSIRHKKKVEICRSVSQTGKGSPEKQTGFTYYHDSSSKGRVYVFNVLKDRPGARADSLNIQKTFGGLGYDVFLHEDFTYGEMMRNIKKIQEDQTLASTGALILFILSHGSDMDTFISADSTGMSLNAIKQKFTAKGCPYLRSKPKIIFANFCRGKDIEEHCLYEDQVPAAEALVDMIIVHASNEGMIALRSKDTGTVFVKSLCEVLNEHGTRLFRHVFIDLSNKMKQKRGTTPVAIDHVFKDFKF